MVIKMRMRAVFDCSADEPGELSFKEGDVLIDVIESGEDGWYSGRIENSTERGLFPYNYVERISESTPTENEKSNNSSPEIMTNIPIVSSNNIIPTPTVKPVWSAGNITSQQQQANDKSSLPGFPPLDAFEAAMSSAGKSSFKTVSSSWTPPNNSNSLPVISPKPKLPTVSTGLKKDVGNPGLGIKIIGNTPPAISEKPQLKSLGLSQDACPTRSRSYSTSSVLNKTEKELTYNAEKTLRPSQLLNGKGTKSTLELALSKGSPSSRPQSNLRSNSFSKQNNPGGNIGGGIALPGLSNIKLSNSISHNIEDEDGYQMIKPSQLRQRQQQKSSPKPMTSKSSAPISSSFKKPAVTTSSWKKYDNNSILSPTGNLPKASTSSKLEEVVSSNPMPRLPSRPTSTASRRSRNSRTSSINSSPNTSTNTTPSINKAILPPVTETNITEKAPPPILKPKPQLAAAAQPNLPPRPSTKSRSTSNPPPLQPKPAAMSSIEILLSKNASAAANDKKCLYSPTTDKTTITPRVSANKPINYQSNKSKPNRPSLDNWRSADTTAGTSDVNLKPSALLNRARSATNPTSNTDWSSMVTRPNNNTAISHSVESSMIEVLKEQPKKKVIPPPPPPSRPPKNLYSSLGRMDDATKHRYEILFESIHDDGYVDGETTRFIWIKSKLSSEELSRVWKECDPDHKGLLDKHAFVDGMGRIDELLLNKQQQVVV